MDAETLVLCQRKMQAYLSRVWPWLQPEIKEDVVSFATEAWLSGRSPITPLRYIAVDYFRKFSLIKTPGRSRDAMAQAGPVPDDMQLKAGPSTPLRLPESYTANLKKEERIILKLNLEWGLSLVEIADLFGVSSARIRHQLNSVEAKIKLELLKDDL